MAFCSDCFCGCLYRKPTSFITHSLLQSMYVSNVTEDEISKIILSLKLCSPGWDGIQAKIVKSTFHLYLQPLVHLLNLSLSQGVFPDELKIAKVIPIFKNDDNMLVNNYRPISILPVFSKIFEQIMCYGSLLGNRLVNLGISKQQHLYLKTKNLI